MHKTDPKPASCSAHEDSISLGGSQGALQALPGICVFTGRLVHMLSSAYFKSIRVAHCSLCCQSPFSLSHTHTNGITMFEMVHVREGTLSASPWLSSPQHALPGFVHTFPTSWIFTHLPCTTLLLPLQGGADTLDQFGPGLD